MLIRGLMVVLTLPTAVLAQTWSTPGFSGNWNVAGNWIPAAVPTLATNAAIQNFVAGGAATYTVTSPVGAQAMNLRVNGSNFAQNGVGNYEAVLSVPMFLQVANNAVVGDLPGSTARLVANPANVQIGNMLQVGMDSGEGHAELTLGTATVSGRATVGGSINLAVPVPPVSSLSLDQTRAVLNQGVSVASNGGQAELLILSGAVADVANLLEVGVRSTIDNAGTPMDLSDDVIYGAVGNLSVATTPGLNLSVLNVDGRMDVGTDGATGVVRTVFTPPVGPDFFYGRINITEDANGVSFNIGQGEVVIGASGDCQVQAGQGDLEIRGKDFFDSPLLFVADGIGYIGRAGGSGQMSIEAASAEISGNVFVGIDPSSCSTGSTQGVLSVGGSARLDLAADLFVGQQSAFGTVSVGGQGGGFLTVDDIYIGQFDGVGAVNIGESGDGPFGELIADYIEVGGTELGNFGFGQLTLQDTGRSDVDTIQIRHPGDEEANGGFVDLNFGHDLSVRLFDADGDGDRFNFFGGSLTLKDGEITDWGSDPLTVPLDAALEGAGTIFTTVICHGDLIIGFPSDDADDTLRITGDFKLIKENPSDFADPQLLIDIAQPTRVAGGTFQQLIVDGTSDFTDGRLIVNIALAVSATWSSNVMVGDTYQIFQFNGPIAVPFAADDIVLPVLPNNWAWDLSQLYTAGTIIVSAGDTRAPTLQSVRSRKVHQ